MNSINEKKIRVGVIGLRRGLTFANNSGGVGLELVAICDHWAERLEHGLKKYPKIKGYTEYDDFLKHDMDAVILANFFHEHAPFAIKALDAGLHVMSETSACKTMAEAVALINAVERSNKIYMFAENYCYFNYIQEMRMLYRSGEIGEVEFAECEYIHPFSVERLNQLSVGEQHWRNWIPSTYYCTHALGPIMYITGNRPVSVNAHSIPFKDKSYNNKNVKRGDASSNMILKLDNDATCLVNGIMLKGEGNWYRVHGTKGLMENMRTHGNAKHLRVVHESFDIIEKQVREKIYYPDFPDFAKEAHRTGHGGGDYFTNYHFADAIRQNKQPILDVYRAVDMTIVGIQGWRSCLDQGNHYEIPDFRVPSMRKKYENDHWSPFPEDRDSQESPPVPSAYFGMNTPSEEAKSFSKKIWESDELHL